MADWSPAIANEFIRRARKDKRTLTQMQLQKLVYIAHGWNLAINGQPLTCDSPEAWEYGPVYKELRRALRHYGSDAVTEDIRYGDYIPGRFEDDPAQDAVAELSANEKAVIDRVYRDYSKYHAFQLSALTHKQGTPWTTVYEGGSGKFEEIPAEMIRGHFVELATRAA